MFKNKTNVIKFWLFRQKDTVSITFFNPSLYFKGNSLQKTAEEAEDTKMSNGSWG